MTPLRLRRVGASDANRYSGADTNEKRLPSNDGSLFSFAFSEIVRSVRATL